MPLDPIERKAMMVRRQVRQIDLAEELGVSQSSVSQALSGERRSARIEQAIAEALGMPVEDVFPASEATEAA